MGLALAAWMAPFAVLILFGGVFADRFTPRRMMIGADTVRVVTQGAGAALFVFGQPQLWQILVISAVNGVAAAMYQPGVSSTVPRVAADVQRANAHPARSPRRSCCWPGRASRAPSSASPGVGVVFAIDAVGFAISAVCLLLLRLPVVAAPPAEAVDVAQPARRLAGVPVQDLDVVGDPDLGGLRRHPVRPDIPLGSVLITEQLGEAAYGWSCPASGAGTVVGGLVAMRVRPARPLWPRAIGLFGFALDPAVDRRCELPLAVLMAAHVVGGAAWAFWSVMWATSVQTQVPPEALNRVTAYEVAGSDPVRPGRPGARRPGRRGGRGAGAAGRLLDRGGRRLRRPAAGARDPGAAPGGPGLDPTGLARRGDRRTARGASKRILDGTARRTAKGGAVNGISPDISLRSKRPSPPRRPCKPASESVR